MAQLNSRDRLQPSLLDRLIDSSPAEKLEGVDARVLSRQQLRAAVLRDLSWLLNATRAEPDEGSNRTDEVALWAANGEARQSVLNFGMPAFAGTTLSSMDAQAIERAVETAIRQYEPRIDPVTLNVSVRLGNEDTSLNIVQITIRGLLWSQPVPLELLLSADVDFETGHTQVREVRA